MALALRFLEFEVGLVLLVYKQEGGLEDDREEVGKRHTSPTYQLFSRQDSEKQVLSSSSAGVFIEDIGWHRDGWMQNWAAFGHWALSMTSG
jgi:hypothetical protein